MNKVDYQVLTMNRVGERKSPENGTNSEFEILDVDKNRFKHKAMCVWCRRVLWRILNQDCSRWLIWSKVTEEKRFADASVFWLESYEVVNWNERAIDLRRALNCLGYRDATSGEGGRTFWQVRNGKREREKRNEEAEDNSVRSNVLDGQALRTRNDFAIRMDSFKVTFGPKVIDLFGSGKRGKNEFVYRKIQLPAWPALTDVVVPHLNARGSTHTMRMTYAVNTSHTQTHELVQVEFAGKFARIRLNAVWRQILTVERCSFRFVFCLEIRFEYCGRVQVQHCGRRRERRRRTKRRRLGVFLIKLKR